MTTHSNFLINVIRDIQPTWNSVLSGYKAKPEIIAQVQEVCIVTEPLLKVLRLVYGNKIAMGYLYETIDRAKNLFTTTMMIRGMGGLRHNNS